MLQKDDWCMFNPLTPSVHLKVMHTETNLQVSAVGVFQYVWPFSGYQVLVLKTSDGYY